MARRYVALGFLAAGLVSLANFPTAADAQDRPPDELSRLLFETYLDGPRKIDSSTIMAASHIVAHRGRESGFWRNVLAELRSDDEHSEVGCVRILGKMLAMDAGARDAIRRQKETGEFTSAQPLAVHLGPEVVAELLERGRKADRLRIDQYVIALARARVPEARDFFASILHARTGPTAADKAQGVAVPSGFQHLDSTRFHAAVGLAQLGEREGIEWLVEHCEDIQGHVQHAWPHGAVGGSLGTCCVAALRQLSGERALTTKAEWQAWANAADASKLASPVVVFRDS